MKRIRRNSHCLFVEDEIYNWAPQSSRYGRRLLWISILVLAGAILFILLAGR